MFAVSYVPLVIHASSATVGMVIGLASKGLMTLAAGIAVMLGAELGTCADTLIASVGRSRQAIKTGVFHLLFNVCTIIVGMILLGWFTQLVLWISGEVSVARKIANAHMLFNILGVFMVIPFLPLLERFLNRIMVVIPNRTIDKEKNLEAAA